jgi:hypothetical protein
MEISFEKSFEELDAIAGVERNIMSTVLKVEIPYFIWKPCYYFIRSNPIHPIPLSAVNQNDQHRWFNQNKGLKWNFW